MKKILIGILILIPLIVLGTVTLVGGIASVAAHIGVESVTIYLNGDADKEDGITLDLENVFGRVFSINDYLETEVLPEKATNPTVSWSISDIRILDNEYENAYQEYLAHKDDEGVIPVIPPVVLIDKDGNTTDRNTTGNMLINAYCSFSLKAMAEQYSDFVTIKVVGYDVKSVNLNLSSDHIRTGDSAKISLNCIPVDSIITRTEWYSSDDSIALVDNNGILYAKKSGETKITCRAYKYSAPEEYIEGTINIDIQPSVSYYGCEVYTHEEIVLLSELGISDVTSIIGGTIAGDTAVFNESVMVIVTPLGSVSVRKCGEKDIKINESPVISRESGYVVAVSDEKIRLTADYVSTFRNESITPLWTSSDPEIAEIDNNGVLALKKNGFITVRAEFEGSTAEMNLNIQHKVSSITLLTTDSSFKVGLARETVFASDRYSDISLNSDKEKNLITLRIQGEPKDADPEDLKGFYSAYNFDIEEGGGYVDFDEERTNCLYIKDGAEGKGKIPVTIKISAKYPKYSAFESYTTAYVSFFVVYGVTVSNHNELIQALKDQKSYAQKSGNVIETTDNLRVCYQPSEKVKVSSQNRYAVCLDKNIAFDPSYKFTDKVRPEIYGDIYGNNHMISALKEQYTEDDCPMLSVEWSDVTISNVILRGNEIEEAEINSETKLLKGHVLDIHSTDASKRYSFLNISIEYSILENASSASYMYSCELTMKGSIIRNMSGTGMYASQRVRHKGPTIYVLPVDLTLENMIFSNCLGTSFDFDTDLFEVYDGTKDRYNFGNTKEESDKFIRENLLTKGLTGSFTQKGFMDVYNWHCVDNLNIMSTGKEEFDAMIQMALGTVIGTDPSLEPFRYRYKNADYFHLGFLIESMTGDLEAPLALKETIWMKISMEDERFTPFYIGDVQEPMFRGILDKFGITIYAYKNDVPLKPSASYVINDRLIDKLHD